jgi:glucosamine-6-phosphate deaminase
MNFDLSSKITIERIPERYYRPVDAFETLRQTRFEKLHSDIFTSEKEGSKSVALEIKTLIENKAKAGEKCVLALSGGSSSLRVYGELVKMHQNEGLSFSNVVVFNVSEFFPITDNNLHSNTQLLIAKLLSKVDIDFENFFTPDLSVDRSSVYDFCRGYEQKIEQFGGLDLVLLSIGLVGNIGYNEPGSQLSSTTRLMLLDNESRSTLKGFYTKNTDVPASAITIGLSTIMNARKVILTAWGEHKADIIHDVVEGKVNDNVPASMLQGHKNAKAVLDLDAAQLLTRLSHPWLVGPCDWTDKMIRRAIVWLCEKTDKPILKLTNKDYNQNGLDELLSLYESAYNVNIKIFNDLQHTITGWPGGKPNADDTYRPERSTPYPKRVIVFSPHPDDDVISMGGTFKRLVDQNHDVHVAYQTSGNIAVGDDEVIRYISLFKNVAASFVLSEDDITSRFDAALKFLLYEKQNGDVDTADVLFLKAQIRREEARAACRYVGLKPENVHFLDLPFYETGKVQKGKLSESDVKIVMQLLDNVQPHQIYLAGDLADPHGTHKVCLNAALAAIDELKAKKWMAECRIWMYRGAWAEWDIDYIEMAVPMSPEQLRNKRNSILKHQSQMESAPYLGNDERLFWQRAEERNQATADLYNKLGLASYEAIEAFVEYKID